MLWTKQFYHTDMRACLKSGPVQLPPPSPRLSGRNYEWFRLCNKQIMSMADKWECPWYAAWDVAFHRVVFALMPPRSSSSYC
jgi:hypothetical protein